MLAARRNSRRSLKIMKKLVGLKMLAAVLTLSMAFSIAGCSQSPDHKKIACGTLKDLLEQYTTAPAPSDLSDLASTNGMLTAELSVWKNDGGDTDPTFKLLSNYSGRMLLFLANGSPSSAKDLQDFESSKLPSLLNQCQITTYTVVKPLKINSGCWNNSSVIADLQEKVSGTWRSYKKIYGLSKNSLCKTQYSNFPWGADFTISRGLIPNSDPTQADGEYRIVWTDLNGYSFSDGTYTHYSCEVKTTKADTVLELWWTCN
jgi:hypothetical protein